MEKLNSVHLNGLRAVEAVARSGSLAGAADELGVSASAVSQQVSNAERQLGRTVFIRGRRGLELTEFGKGFAARLTNAFRELAEAMRLAEDNANILVISVAPAFASRWLVPRLSRFYAAEPEVMLRIDASTKLTEFERSDVDLAIRLGDGDWPGVRAELLLAQQIFPVCAPGIAARLRSIEDLAGQCVIRDERTMIHWSDWFRSAGVPPVEAVRGASFTDPTLCLEAAIAGHGVMLAWDLLAADALADGRLVAPFGVTAKSGLGYYVVTAAAGRPSRNSQKFRRWLEAEVGATMARFGPGGGISRPAAVSPSPPA
jgi:DNA-binding transcriptional LysR family regulator